MKRGTQLALALGLAASVAACGGNGNDAANTANTPSAAPARDAGPVGTSGAIAAGDRDFVQDQIQDGQKEVALGELAQKRATNAQVKKFAQMMVQDHQAAGTELKQLASKHNVQLDADTAEDVTEARERMMKLEGREFDQAYMSAMVQEHEEAVNEVEKKVESDNADVRQWATKTLPKLRQHLEEARRLNDTIEKAGTRK